MDNSDAEFDSYWDNEAKNQNRNRIRVGRQYQASIPPRLKPGEKDGRKSEELETLRWKPDQLSDQALDEYLSMAKGIGLFSKSLDSSKQSETSLQSAIKGLSEFVTSHHPCHHDDGCKVTTKSGESSKANIADWSPSEAQLFAQALEACGKNFCAIKKEYLPWKPVRSIIEYYYHGKTEKSEENVDVCGDFSPKKESSPVPSCSKDGMPFIKEELLTPDESPSETSSMQDSFNTDSPGTFLENSRATDLSRDTPTMGVEAEKTNDRSLHDLSTVGSLKFFLDGRLVLKLKAQRDGGSGTSKCQWVQSDCASNVHSKKDKLKKAIPIEVEDPLSSAENTPNKQKKKIEESYKFSPENDAKKPKITANNECDRLLCSPYWTPPVADGPIDNADDGSSKTSEGYISPSNFKLSRNDEDSSETFKSSDSKNSIRRLNSPEICGKGEGKSALVNRNCGGALRNLNYGSSSKSNNCGVQQKQWKWSGGTMYTTKMSPSSFGGALVDGKSPKKDDPLNLSSKPDHLNHNNSDGSNSPNLLKTKVRTPELDTGTNSNHIFQSSGSNRPLADKIGCCESDDSDSCGKCTDLNCKQDGCACCSMEYECSLSKCAKDCLCEEHLCNKNDHDKIQTDSPGCIVNNTTEDICKKEPKYCGKKESSFYHYYPQCIPYYVAYGVPPPSQTSSDSTVTEVPLDLSSNNDSNSIKENDVTTEKLLDKDASQNSEAIERGMLYQLLKNNK